MRSEIMNTEEEKKSPNQPNENDLPKMGVTVQVPVLSQVPAVQPANEINKGRKRRRLATELERLTRDEYRIKKTTESTTVNANQNPSANPSSVQLYATDFDNIAIAQTTKEGRPKRRIKAVERYKDTRLTYAQQMELSRLKGKCGTGFLCPLCSTHLSYDLKQCWQCGADCGYFPGIGVLLLRDRSEVAKIDDGLLGATSGSVLNLEQHHTKAKQNGHTSRGKQISKLKRQTIPRNAKSNGNEGIFPRKNESGEVFGADAFYVSKEKAREILSNAETTECEACLQVFLPSYLQRHRRRFHCLDAGSFGCPYCTTKDIFKTMKERDEHVAKMHPGKPLHLSDEEMNRNRLYIYACPKCDTAMAYSDLRDHLKNVHKEDFQAVQHMITCMCPFCLQGSTPRRTTFLTADALLTHVKLCHKGCTISGKKVKLGGGVVDKSICGKKLKLRGGLEEKVASIEKDELYIDPPDDNLESSPSDFYWYALQPDILGHEAKMKGASYRKGQHVDSILKTVEDQIKKLEEREMVSSKRSDNIDDEHYMAENRLYIRGIRERTNMAEGEALEKFNFKDQCEERQRLFDYQNRGKKKSREELELEEFMCRPFSWQGTSLSMSSVTRRGKCTFGDDCNLCNISLQDKIETTRIPSRGFRKITDADLPDDLDAEDHQTKAATKSQRSRLRRNDKIELWKLMELKHSLQFIRKFNSGLNSNLKYK
jgi:hypothetical protein